MPTEWLPRFADIKSVEELSALLAYPMIIAAHVLQSGLSIDLGDFNIEAPNTADSFLSILILCCLFVAKAVISGFIALFVHAILALGQLKIEIPLQLLFGGLLMSFALAGVFGHDTALVKTIGLIPAWYYALFVYGVHLISWDKKNSAQPAA